MPVTTDCAHGGIRRDGYQANRTTSSMMGTILRPIRILNGYLGLPLNVQEVEMGHVPGQTAVFAWLDRPRLFGLYVEPFVDGTQIMHRICDASAEYSCEM